MTDVIYSVGQFNMEVRELIEKSFKEIWVVGEISNLATPASGHIYFTLKDEDAQVRCAFFRNRRMKASTNVKNGVSVHLRGRPSLYENRGEFQIIVEYIELAGEGVLRRRFDELKHSLKREGLFEPSQKQPLPRMPQCIGIISSLTGAAITDIISTLNRRYRAANILIYPVAVQGDGSASQIVEALTLANQMRICDVLIIARGGGSIEDLWAFNEAIVVRAIHSSDIPIVTGIGHEIDTTLADFVADYRAETPTAAAESVTPDSIEIINNIVSLHQRLGSEVDHLIRKQSQHVDLLASRLRHPIDLLKIYQQEIDNLQSRQRLAYKGASHNREIQTLTLQQRLYNSSPRILVNNYQIRLRSAASRLSRAKDLLSNDLGIRLSAVAGRLHALSPQHTLQRGYSILRNAEDRALLPNVQSIYYGQTLEVEMADGWFEATVDRVSKETTSIAAIALNKPSLKRKKTK